MIIHPRYTLIVTTTAGGTTNPALGSYKYGWGEIATVSAIPSSGYVFDRWTLDSSSNYSNPISVTMDKNYTLTAFFKSAPPLRVGGMAAPIVIPMNEPNLLTPLIWLASAIIFPIVLTVVFVKLKKKKL